MTVAERLLRWAHDRQLEVSWGSGAKIGFGTFVVQRADGATAQPFGVATRGWLALYPQAMTDLPPFDQHKLRLDFIRRLAAAAGVAVEDDVADQSFKTFLLQKLAQAERLEAAIAALDWFLEASRSGSLSYGETED